MSTLGAAAPGKLPGKLQEKRQQHKDTRMSLRRLRRKAAHD